MPGKRDRPPAATLGVRQFGSQVVPTQGGAGGSLECEAVFVEFWPSAVDASSRRRTVAAIRPTELVIGLRALLYRMPEILHHHLAARRPAPHIRLLRTKGYSHV